MFYSDLEYSQMEQYVLHHRPVAPGTGCCWIFAIGACSQPWSYMTSGPITVLAAFALAGCVRGATNYSAPAAAPRAASAESPTTRVYPTSLDTAWQALVAHSAATVFVVDNIERDSHFLSLSFAATDPTAYVDCGEVVSEVANARGRRSYRFPAAAAAQTYETREGTTLYQVDRRVSLSGKANVVMARLTDTTTQVRVNARYVVVRNATMRPALGRAVELPPLTVAFTSGAASARGDRGVMTCAPTHALERGVLDGIADRLGGAAR